MFLLLTVPVGFVHAAMCFNFENCYKLKKSAEDASQLGKLLGGILLADVLRSERPSAQLSVRIKDIFGWSEQGYCD